MADGERPVGGRGWPSFAELGRSNPFLSSLDEAARGRLADHARHLEIGRGAVLFAEGDADDGAYLVVAGLLRVVVTERDGTETTIRLARRGTLVGELAAIDGGRRVASVLALRRTRLYRIPPAALAAELPAPGTMARALLHALADAVRADTRQLARRAGSTADRRIAGVVVADPTLLTDVSQGELAGLVGLSRQVVNQVLQCWARHGWVERRDGRVTVIDRDRLAAGVLDG